MNDLYLSYSGRKCYLTCPKQYEFRYILKDKSSGDPRNSLFGSSIGKVFEWFYSNNLWSKDDPESAAMAVIDDAVDVTYDAEEYSRGTDRQFELQLMSDMKKFVPLGVKTIRDNGFLTPYSRAEVNLTVNYIHPSTGLSLRLGGRADFIHSKDMRDVWILDGKASKHRQKYVDSDQLIWYAVLHYLKFRVAPTRLGFIFWAFPEDPLLWVAYGSDDMRALVSDTVRVANEIISKNFAAKTSGECRRCPYLGKCEDGTKYIAHRRVETGGRVTDDIFDMEKI